MAEDFPSSVLFCCDHNAIRSPMAEGLMKKFYGHTAYVQSAGVHNDLEIDGFAIAVCAELDVELDQHRSRSFDEMQQWGDDMSGFDLIVSLSPASQRLAQEYTRHFHIDVEYWAIMDPSDIGNSREDKLAAYRQSRDHLVKRIIERFGPPTESDLPEGF